MAEGFADNSIENGTKIYFYIVLVAFNIQFCCHTKMISWCLFVKEAIAYHVHFFTIVTVLIYDLYYSGIFAL